jgi:hypothetical protein
VPAAEHGAAWNADPQAYESELAGFLAEVQASIAEAAG